MTNATTTYSNRSNALRAAKKAGYNKEQVEIRHNVETDRYYYIPMVDTSELDAKYDEQYGFHECPECGTHLENGVCDFEGLLDARDGNFNEAYKLQQKEFACMVCDYEWGDDVKHPADEEAVPSNTTASKRTYKRTGESSYPDSTVDSPVDVAWNLYDELAAATGFNNIVRKVFIADAIGLGINPNTASTQFTAWKKTRATDRGE
jgi:hypothetical protein